MKEKFSKLFAWIGNNKFSSILILLVLYFIFTRVGVRNYISNTMQSEVGYDSYEMMGAPAPVRSGVSLKSTMMPPSGGGVAPRPDITDRKVITSSYLSLQVKSVRDTMEIIKASAVEMGGYMVDSDVNSPEIGESGSIAIRIPTDKLDDAVDRFRRMAVKIVSENISGTDITDQYMDIQERLSRLEATKTRFEEILDKAVTVEEILMVQNQIFALQDQIDSYKGQLEYMNTSSSTTLIRIYLSTDELGLPYTPSQSWRPGAIFKQASRSMLLNLIKICYLAIWIAVYSPLILVVIVTTKLIKKVIKRLRS